MNTIAAVLAAPLFLGLAGPSALTPSGLSDKKVTMELRQADVANVYRLLGEVGGRPITTDACLAGAKVDVLLRAVPVPVALQVLAAKLGTEYVDEQGKPVLVVCRAGARPASPALEKIANPAPDAWLDAHVSLDTHGPVSTHAVMQQIQHALGLKDIRLDGPDRSFTLAFDRLRVRTLMEVLKDVAELETLEVRGDVLYAKAKG